MAKAGLSQAQVADDNWVISGCPVNGPAVASMGQQVAVAWFTQAENVARVKVAFSSDGGLNFGSPIVLDEEKAIGRVGGNGWRKAWVSCSPQRGRSGSICARTGGGKPHWYATRSGRNGPYPKKRLPYPQSQ